MRDCAKAAEVVKAKLFQKAERVINLNSDKPVLWHYSFDGTPMTIVTRHSAGASLGKRVRREGGSLQEPLIKRGFVAVNDGLGNRYIALLMTPPLPLGNGKAAWNLYSAAADFFPLLREKDHHSIAITHYGLTALCFTHLSGRCTSAMSSTTPSWQRRVAPTPSCSV